MDLIWIRSGSDLDLDEEDSEYEEDDDREKEDEEIKLDSATSTRQAEVETANISQLSGDMPQSEPSADASVFLPSESTGSVGYFTPLKGGTAGSAKRASSLKSNSSCAADKHESRPRSHTSSRRSSHALQGDDDAAAGNENDEEAEEHPQYDSHPSDPEERHRSASLLGLIDSYLQDNISTDDFAESSSGKKFISSTASSLKRTFREQLRRNRNMGGIEFDVPGGDSSPVEEGNEEEDGEEDDCRR